MHERRDVRRGLERVNSAVWRAVAAMLAACALAVIGSACTSARPVLAVFFDALPQEGEEQPPRPVVHQPRRPTYKPPVTAAKVVEVPEPPPVIDWIGRYASLPRNDAGEVAWTRALDEKMITPKPGIAADAKDEDPTDMDLEFVPEGQPEYKVVFAHKPHTQWMGCPSCHTGVFEMEKGKAKMTMANLGEGAYCGVCHGKVASPDLSGCPTCHTAMGK